MTVAFLSWCSECFEQVRFTHGRPANHDCLTDYDCDYDYDEEDE